MEGFEDFYLLTYQDTYMDIHSTSSDEVYIWEIVKRVYKDVWNHADKIPSAALTREWMRTVIEKVQLNIIQESQLLSLKILMEWFIIRGWRKGRNCTHLYRG